MQPCVCSAWLRLMFQTAGFEEPFKTGLCVCVCVPGIILLYHCIFPTLESEIAVAEDSSPLQMKEIEVEQDLHHQPNFALRLQAPRTRAKPVLM
eukprot:2368347-Amphidinium_carterae.1